MGATALRMVGAAQSRPYSQMLFMVLAFAAIGVTVLPVNHTRLRWTVGGFAYLGAIESALWFLLPRPAFWWSSTLLVGVIAAVVITWRVLQARQPQPVPTIATPPIVGAPTASAPRPDPFMERAKAKFQFESDKYHADRVHHRAEIEKWQAMVARHHRATKGVRVNSWPPAIVNDPDYPSLRAYMTDAAKDRVELPPASVREGRSVGGQEIVVGGRAGPGGDPHLAVLLAEIDRIRVEVFRLDE